MDLLLETSLIDLRTRLALIYKELHGAYSIRGQRLWFVEIINGIHKAFARLRSLL